MRLPYTAAASTLSGLLGATRGDPVGVQASHIVIVDLDAAAESRAAFALLRDLKASVPGDLPRVTLLSRLVVSAAVHLPPVGTATIAALERLNAAATSTDPDLLPPLGLAIPMLSPRASVPGDLRCFPLLSRPPLGTAASERLNAAATSTDPDLLPPIGLAIPMLSPQWQTRQWQTRLRQMVAAPRVRRERGILDMTLRDMGFYTRGHFARLMVALSVFTFMSKGVREGHLRLQQLSRALQSLRVGLMGVVDESQSPMGVLSESEIYGSPFE